MSPPAFRDMTQGLSGPSIHMRGCFNDVANTVRPSALILIYAGTKPAFHWCAHQRVLDSDATLYTIADIGYRHLRTATSDAMDQHRTQAFIDKKGGGRGEQSKRLSQPKRIKVFVALRASPKNP